jgi:hypothetical protein
VKIHVEMLSSDRPRLVHQLLDHVLESGGRVMKLDRLARPRGSRVRRRHGIPEDPVAVGAAHERARDARRDGPRAQPRRAHRAFEVGRLARLAQAYNNPGGVIREAIALASAMT